jgi:D-xylose transport system permease protein
MLLVILPGHVDLAAGSAVGLSGAVAAMLISDPSALFKHLLGVQLSVQPCPAWLAMLLALLGSMALYAGMGACVAYQRMPAFIVTLGGLLAFKGLHWQAIANATVPVVRGGNTNALSQLTTFYVALPYAWAMAAVAFVLFAALTFERTELWLLRVVVVAQLLAIGLIVCGRYRGVPLAAIILVVLTAVVYVITEKTTLGRYLYAIGGNEQAARLAGIEVQRSSVIAFVMMGAIAALSGFLQTSYAGSSTTTIGQLMELDAVAACVIGGASLKGGRGSALGVLFGALIMAVLLNGMTLMAVSPEHKLIARGVILALAVWVDLRLSGEGR